MTGFCYLWFREYCIFIYGYADRIAAIDLRVDGWDIGMYVSDGQHITGRS